MMEQVIFEYNFSLFNLIIFKHKYYKVQAPLTRKMSLHSLKGKNFSKS